jgi:hypothetical protein
MPRRGFRRASQTVESWSSCSCHNTCPNHRAGNRSNPGSTRRTSSAAHPTVLRLPHPWQQVTPRQRAHIHGLSREGPPPTKWKDCEGRPTGGVCTPRARSAPSISAARHRGSVARRVGIAFHRPLRTGECQPSARNASIDGLPNSFHPLEDGRQAWVLRAANSVTSEPRESARTDGHPT